MKLLFQQRLFSWFDSYDIFGEQGTPLYRVQGRLDWGHRLEIYDARGEYQGMIREKIFRFLPTFEIYQAGEYKGCIRREFTWFRPQFSMDYFGWRVDGNWWEWDYRITDARGGRIADIHKEIFNWTDTYVIDVEPEHALHALMVVLAIDAEKCSRGS